MEKLLALSIFSGSANEVSADVRTARTWVKSWMVRKVEEKAAETEEKNRPKGVDCPRAKQGNQNQRFAVEFDGLNCFETLVMH